MNSREIDLTFWQIVGQDQNRQLTAAEQASRNWHHAYHDPRLSGIALLYGLVESQEHVVDVSAHERAMNDLADMSTEYQLDCDAIRQLLVQHETSLAEQAEQPILLQDDDFCE